MPAKRAAPVFERLVHGRFGLREIELRRGGFSQITLDVFHPAFSLLDSGDDVDELLPPAIAFARRSSSR